MYACPNCDMKFEEYSALIKHYCPALAHVGGG